MAIYGDPILAPVKLDTTSLFLHERKDINPHFFCVSWREMRVPEDKKKRKTNRKFYVEGGRCWSITFQKTLEMMKLADSAGYLEDNKSNHGAIRNVDVAIPGKQNYVELINSVLLNAGFDDEWQNSEAIICNQIDGIWRKVMLINKGKVTFRSLTLDNKYKLADKKHAPRNNSKWHLDRAMLDAHPMAFKHWLKHLESHSF